MVLPKKYTIAPIPKKVIEKAITGIYLEDNQTFLRKMLAVKSEK